MRGRVKSAVRTVASALGYDVHRRDHAHPARRIAAMRARGINLVLDVGANSGQYVTWLRKAGYDGEIVSFEPIPSAFAALTVAHQADRRWRGVQTAVGAVKGHAVLNIAESSLLSSLLRSEALLRDHIPAARIEQRITVPVVALVDIWDELVQARHSVMLKIDTQGFEHSVLNGVGDRLAAICMVELEMSLVALYQDGSSIHDALPRLRSAGFEVISIESGYVDAATGQVLDVDVLAGRPI
jgi:FkbM family methyltransferase